MNSGHVSMPTQNIITITTNHTTLPHVQLLNCITLPLWGSHYSLWLICNDWLSSTTRAQTDPHIDYTQSKKENPAVQHKILIVTAPQYHSLCNPSYVFQHTSSEKICYWSAICVYVFECVCVEDGQLWASVFTYQRCSYWLCSGDPYLSCVGDPSTLTGLLYHHSSQTLTNDSR